MQTIQEVGQHGLAKAAGESGVLNNSAKILSALRPKDLPMVFVRRAQRAT
jgi:hypothetical protein